MSNTLASLSRLTLQTGCLAAAGSFALANALFFPWPALLTAVIALRPRRHAPSDAHGSARWGNLADAQDANLWGHRYGLPLGYLSAAEQPSLRHGVQSLFAAQRSETAVRTFLASLGCRRLLTEQPLRLPKDGIHTGIFASPGGFKTSGVIISALISDPSNAFVIDPKGEITNIVAKIRKKRFGKKAFIVDPYQLLGIRTHCYNPLFGIDVKSPAAPDEILDLAAAIVLRTGRDTDSSGHWLTLPN